MDLTADYTNDNTRVGDYNSLKSIAGDCQRSPLTLTDLPEECLRLVLSHLPLVDKFRLERVCKLWQYIIYDLQIGLRFTKLSSNKCKSIVNYCHTYGHTVTNDDWVPQLLTFSSRTRQSPIKLDNLENVLKKCGQSIRVLNLDLALIDEQVFETIVLYCPHIHCISLSSSTGITDDCLQILAKHYGQDLVHINLQCSANRQKYFTNQGLFQFLTDCPNIRTLFLASIRSQKSYRLSVEHLDLMTNMEYLCAHIPDVMCDELQGLEHLECCSQLTRLLIDGIIYSETVVSLLTHSLSQNLKHLKCLTLQTYCENPLDSELIVLARGLIQLEELYIRLNVITISTLEAISYFQNLIVLDFGIWKPFETGLLSLTLLPLQYCPKLQVLRLSNLLLTDLLLENIHIFCPKLEKIFLNNMFDLTDDSLRSLSKLPNLKTIRLKGVANIASDVTENGLISVLDTMTSLILLEIPIIFDISDDLYSCFKRYAKKYRNNYLTFVCGPKGSAIEDREEYKRRSPDHKFFIVSEQAMCTGPKCFSKGITSTSISSETSETRPGPSKL